MGLSTSTLVVLVSVLSTFLFSRTGILYTFYANAPERLPQVNNLGQIDIRFQNDLRNCEDIHLNVAQGYALLSCDPGRDEWNTVMGTFVNPEAPPETGIYVYRYSDANSVPLPLKMQLPTGQNRSDFHPLGIEVHEPSNTLFVVNHAFSGSRVDIYKLDIESGSASFQQSVQDYGQLPTPNAIVAVSETEFFVTNDHYILAREFPILAKIETYGGFPGGSVAHVKLKDGVAKINTVARIAFANGIALLDANTLAVASSNTCGVQLLSIKRSPTSDTPELKLTKSLTLPFITDNVSVDSAGKLLIAGHPHAPSLEKVAKRNGICRTMDGREGDWCKLDRLSWLAEWSELEGVTTLYSGSGFGPSTTVVRDWKRRIVFATTLYGDGLPTWKI